MKKTHLGVKWVRAGMAIGLVMFALVFPAVGREANPYPYLLKDFRMRDPFVHVDRSAQVYRLYFSGGAAPGRAGVQMRTSKDLVHWSPPKQVLEVPAERKCRAVWAPEMHEWRGKYYMFATISTFDGAFPDLQVMEPGNWKKIRLPRRGTWIYRADSPKGPFKEWSAAAIPPTEWSTLDGTLWEEDGKPYMVFCHEWSQVRDGRMLALEMSADLKRAVGKPMELFRASARQEAPKDSLVTHVTDGPFMYRSRNGSLLMIWSSFCASGYSVYVTKSASGKLAGPWGPHRRIFEADGGHGMLFRTLDGRLAMSLHQPNHGETHTRILSVEDLGDTLRVAGALACPAWPTATNEMRPWCYNWWMGNAVDAVGLERQAKDFEASGFGGFHAIPIYEVKDARYREVKYLSPEWTRLFNAGKKSAEGHGLELDLSTGCGWCFGGPWLKPEQGIWRLQRERDPRRLKKGAKVLWSGKDAKGRPLILAAYPSGMLVKRAPATGRGPMMDPFSPEVMRTHLAPFTAAFDRPGAAKPRSMYHDSYEYYGAAWTPKFFEAFLAKRGYDLRDHLAAFAGVGDADEICRVKHDYRETLSDLVLDTFTVWTDWCRARGMKTRNEAHGAPANWLDFYALADIPETEMFNTDRDILVSKFASSAAHLKGTPQVASESCTWINEHFNATLDEVQVFLNQLLLSGVNHVFYHGCCYSPVEAAWPGWCFYASLEMNPRNPIWRDAKVLNEWLTRVQSLAQTSTPDEDVLVYWPIHDFWSTPDGYVKEMSVHNKWFAGQPFGILSRRLYDAGVSFDYVSDRLLTTLPPAAKSHWKTIVIPACETMPLATARTLARLAKDGYRIVFDGPRPTDVPGLKTDAATRKSLAEALASIPGTVPASVGSVPVSVGTVPKKMAGGCVDVAQVGRCEPFTKASGLAYRRFRRGSDTLYFVINNSQNDVAGTYKLTAEFKQAWSLDPMTGDIKPLSVKGGLSLSLPAGESIWFWLSDQGGQTPADQGGQSPSEKRVVELTGPWTLTPVCGGPDVAQGGQSPWPRTMAKLSSWSRNEDGSENPFCGTVCYRTTFVWKPVGTDPKSMGTVPTELDLGTVCHSAQVRVNGQNIGARIRKPYKFAIPAKVLKIGENVLEVEVTSTAANRIRDLDRRKVEWKIFGDINIVGRNYKPFDAAEWPLVDAGLLGPVTIKTPAIAGVLIVNEESRVNGG